MKIVTVSQMVEIEKASDAAGHSYDAMMELAGRAVAAAVLRHMQPWDTSGGVLVLAGPGNNGGDGLVAARYLRQWEPRRAVTVYCWKRKSEGDANYDALRRLKAPIAHAEEDDGLARLHDLLLEADVIVDALLGTGASRPIEGALADLLDAVRAGIEQRRAEEALAAGDGDEDEAAAKDPQVAASVLKAVADFDFLRLPPYAETPLPQIVAVDCPSGLNCDTGQLDPKALPADLTITFANPKVGHFVVDGPRACGRLEVADIGADPDLAAAVQVELATPAFVKSLLPRRPLDANKGTFGKAMIVAGSANYSGAAHLAGAAAYRVGAGLVTLAVPGSIQRTLAAGLAETTWLLLPEQMGVIGPAAVKMLAEEIEGYAALLVGPGLTQEKEAVQFVQQLFDVGSDKKRAAGFLTSAATAEPTTSERSTSEVQVDTDDGEADANGPTVGFLARRRPAAAKSRAHSDFVKDLPRVIDADALNALSQVKDWHAHVPAHSILTPHPGEMARLCGCSTRDVQADRLNLAREKAAEWQQVVLLKGAYTVIAAPDGRMVVLPFANPALATAGSGDVLAGAIVGALSQGLASFEAALLGGYLHGLAGELAGSDIGDAGVMAGDLLARLPEGIRRLRAA